MSAKQSMTLSAEGLYPTAEFKLAVENIDDGPHTIVQNGNYYTVMTDQQKQKLLDDGRAFAELSFTTLDEKTIVVATHLSM